MQALNKLCLIFVTMFIVSCNPDDGNGSSTTDSIVGEWQLTSIVFGIGTTEEPLDDCDTLQIYNFKEDQSLELYYEPSSFCGSTTYTLSYTLADNTLTTNNPIGGGVYSERNTIETLNTTTLKYIEVWNSVDSDLLPESRPVYTYTRVN